MPAAGRIPAGFPPAAAHAIATVALAALAVRAQTADGPVAVGTVFAAAVTLLSWRRNLSQGESAALVAVAAVTLQTVIGPDPAVAAFTLCVTLLLRRALAYLPALVHVTAWLLISGVDVERTLLAAGPSALMAVAAIAAAHARNVGEERATAVRRAEEAAAAARTLNDEVIQHLSRAEYAEAAGDTAEATEARRTALRLAQDLVRRIADSGGDSLVLPRRSER